MSDRYKITKLNHISDILTHSCLVSISFVLLPVLIEECKQNHEQTIFNQHTLNFVIVFCLLTTNTFIKPYSLLIVITFGYLLLLLILEEFTHNHILFPA